MRLEGLSSDVRSWTLFDIKNWTPGFRVTAEKRAAFFLPMTSVVNLDLFASKS
jgi:hypothetical protein